MSCTANSAADAPYTLWLSRRAQMFLLALLVGLGVVLRVANLDGVIRRTPDEYTYTNSANTLLDLGTTAGYPVLFANFAKDPVRPSPTRIGYHALLMATMRLTGDRTPLAGAWLACAASVLSLVLLAMIGWRFFTPTVALVATLLYAVSPAELMFARRCWEESLIELLCLASLGIACAVTAGSRRPLLYPLFALVGVFAFVVKELCAATFLLAAAWCIVVLLRRRALRGAAWFAASALAAVTLALAWTAERLGGLVQLSQLAVVGSKVSEVSPYAQAYTCGPAWLMLLGLWILSATTALLAMAGLATLAMSYFAPARTVECVPNRTILLGLTLTGALFIVLTMVFPEKLNLRFICPAFGPLALLAGVGFCALLQVIRGTLPAAEARTLSVLAVVFLLLAAAVDYRNFTRNFRAADMQDLSIRMVLESSGRSLPAASWRLPLTNEDQR